MTPPAVVIDATNLHNIAAGSGIGTYTHNLVWYLAGRPDLRVMALCDRAQDLPDGVERFAVRRSAERPRAELIEHAVRLPVELRLRRPPGAVFHNTGFHLPPAVPHPVVQTLHDVIPLVTPDPDQAALRARWRRLAPRYRRADAVIAVSRYSADEGIRVLGLDPRRVHVVHHGVDPAFHPVPRAGTTGDRPPYILMVAAYSQRKGFPFALAMIDELADLGYPHRLLIAGKVHPWGRDEVKSLVNGVRHRDRVEMLGFAENLPQLYREADCFIMMSRMEGFGLPCIEAMACGTPVVCFDNTSLPEVAGAAARLVPDGDGWSATAAVRSVLDSPALAEEMSAKGLAHARTFTWAASAQAHAEIYLSVAAR